ncbi:CAP domain-containing protein [Lentibacillus cibarius]|uniref:CAP domain-containing protein n=1 Tax=Lentibacillus cibarius TaxID=2583219 RepID=UPI00163DA104|nr:CAP domain-containing protein [Lentibacillus cibarius]
MRKVTATGLALSIVFGGVTVADTLTSPTVAEASTDKTAIKQQYRNQDEFQNKVLDYINDAREKVGVPDLKLDPTLVKEAENHAYYLYQNGYTREDSDNDFENEGATGYTGYGVLGRLIKLDDSIENNYDYGYEGFTVSGEDFDAILKQVLDDRKLRDYVLSNIVQSLGVSKVDESTYLFTVKYFSGYSIENPERSEEKLVHYPYDGQTDVTPVNDWYGGQGYEKREGYPITIYGKTSLDLIDFTLYDDKVCLASKKYIKWQ